MASSDDPSAGPPKRGGRGGFLGLGARREDEAEVAKAHARWQGAELIDQAEAFQSLRVQDLMTPRADIIALDIDTPFDEAVAQFRECEHSRLPVYRGTLDDPLGVVHLKDLFKLMADPERPPKAGDLALNAIRRDTLYVPPSMRAADLLLKMQASRMHMGLVIDEFGGVDGLVTLEDVVESVVGDIDDEHDEAHPIQVIARPGGVFEADARAPLEDLEAELDQKLVPESLADEEIETVAGLVTALAGRVPQRGEVISHPSGWEFEVLDADPRRVKRLRVRPAAAPLTPAPTEEPSA
jgi:CBS domain containing-hemolysin-like protein